jgi:pSer/pThr/pTyr-binding forkhead associated (FHA) protein
VANPIKLSVSGSELTFDKAEVRLGRTADNDIVVKDPAASRSHARVYLEGDAYLVEDLKSGNGTKLNGVKLTTPSPIKTGDTITIGDTVYTFTTTLTTPIAELQTMLRAPLAREEAPGNQTLLGPVPRFDQTVEVPPPTDDDTYRGTAPKFDQITDESPAHTKEQLTTDERPALVSDLETMLKPPLSAPPLQDDPLLSTRLLPPRQGAVPAPIANLETREMVQEQLSAAERMREKREAQKTRLGRLAYAWRQLTPGARKTVAIGSTAFVLLAIGGVFALTYQPEGPRLVEPDTLKPGAAPIQESFGQGEGVTFRRPDMKVFTFTAAAPTRIVGVLQYSAKDISKDEVAITLNGATIGTVPPDTLDAARVNELVLPVAEVKKNEPNQLVFDNVKNPPGDEAWRVFNLRVELTAIPDMTPDEAIASIREDLTRATAFFDQRDIGPENLFKAWKGYRDAWLKLESLPGAKPNELYVQARAQQRETAALLDKRCSAVQLEVVKIMSARRPDYQLARDALDEALMYFPTREHRCHHLIREMMSEVGRP